MANKKPFPECKLHKDCFALREDGRCKCLTDTDFGGKDCSFYKPISEVDPDEIEQACKLYAETHGGSAEGEK